MAHIVITGCNRGIGLELTTQYAARGDTVSALCRRASPDLRGIGVQIHEGIDVTDAKSLSALADSFEDRSVDVLINNAGILRSDRLETADPDAMLEQYRVNAIGPLLVTRSMRDKLKDGGKLIIVSSRVGSIDDNGSGNNYGYRASKTAVNQIGTNLKHDLKPRGIAVGMLHPGLVATDMTGGSGIDAATAAAGLIARVDELTLDESGGFWHAEGYRLPW